MTDLSFVGNTDDFSDKQLEFVRQVLKERGFSDEKVHIEPAGKVDDNFVANVKRITVESNGEVFKMIAKVAPKLPMLRDSMGANALFNNENVMYTEVLPKLTELQKAADIPQNERFRFAECYGTLMDEFDELILLEDLKLANYTMLDKFTSLPDDCVRIVLKNFAALHAMSYALKNKEPGTYDDFRKKLVNTWLQMDKMEDMTMWLDLQEAEIQQIVDGEKYRIALKGLMKNMFEYTAKNASIDSASKYSVIQQGDSWTNNIMFKLKDGKPEECCLIDYQLAKESSPVFDIQYMVFACTDYESRSKHYHDWIDYYHTELDKALAEYGLKANLVYPRDQLDVDLRRCGKQSLAIAVMLTSILVREMEEAAKMKDMMAGEGSMQDKMEASRISNLDQNTLEKFKTKIEGLVDSFQELGYL